MTAKTGFVHCLRCSMTLLTYAAVATKCVVPGSDTRFYFGIGGSRDIKSH